MSGKRAAAALLQFDSDLAAEIAALNAQDWPLLHEEAVAFARRAYALWTVSLVSAAAGVTEEVTVAALMYYHMRCGSTCVCQGIAKRAATPVTNQTKDSKC
jgi:hypothetical protein